MKKILLFLLLMVYYYGFGQSSNTIFDQLGVTISYSYQQIGTVTNPETNTKFNKYKIVGVIRNNSNKYYYINADISYDDQQVRIENKSDDRFHRNGSISARIDSHCWEGCRNYPGNGAYQIVACPNTSIRCEKTFLHPQDKGNPDDYIKWGQTSIGELKKEEEQSTKQSTSNTTPAEWGAWMNTGCYTGIEYRVKQVELYNLNYQVHMYFEVRSTYNESVSFNFNLKDQNGKIHFGEKRSISSGGEIEFVHKMDSKKITSIQISDAKFSNGKAVVCGGDGTSNSGGNNPNSQSGGNAQARADELNGYLLQIPDDDQEKKNIINSVDRITSNNSLSDQQMADQIKPYIERAKKRANQLGNESNNTSKSNNSSSRLSAEQKQANQEAERQATQQKQAQKAYEDKVSSISNYMQKGESALSSGNYDEAISNFAQASNICSDDPQFQQQRLEAQNALARAQKAKADAARKIRVEEKQKQEAATNTAVVGAATATVGLMALLKDDYTEKPFAARAQIGLGAENMSMTMVETSTSKETIQSAVTANFLIGLNLTLFNDKAIQLHLNPYFDLGIVALQAGNQGASTKYGGNAMLQLGLKKDQLFKLFVEGGYFKKSGTLNYDKDVANGGSSATDYITKGSFDYSVIRYGGGIMLHGEADTGEVRIKPGIFFEEFSFAKGQRVMSFNLHANIMSQIVIEFTYSKNYVIPGGVYNPGTFTSENKDFWSFKIIRQGLLTGK